MAVVQSKHVSTCKICTAASATLINALLEKRHNKERGEDGKLITFKTITESLPDYGVEASLAAVKRHVSKGHIEFVTEKEAELRAAAEKARAESTLEVFDRVLGPDYRERDCTPDEILALQRALYVKELAEKAERGEPLGISHDHALKGVGEGTKRNTDDFRNQLILAMANAAGANSYELEEQNAETVEYQVVEENVELVDGGYEEDEEGGEDA